MAVTITSALAATSPAVPLTYPRILYENLFQSGTVTATGIGSPLVTEESAEFAVENCYEDPATWNFWRPAAMPATLTLVLSSATLANALMIVAHTLGTDGVTVVLEYRSAVSPEAWTEIQSVSPTDDTPLVILFEDQTRDAFRVTFNPASPSVTPSIGYVQLGKALAMPFSVALDHPPITQNEKTKIEPQRAEGGQYLGRSIRQQGAMTELRFRHLPSSFVRGSEFQAFKEAAKKNPFGWVQNPQGLSTEVAYVWTSEDIQPRHAGLPDRLNVTNAVNGLLT